jgi:homoserine dehydrogenase
LWLSALISNQNLFCSWIFLFLCFGFVSFARAKKEQGKSCWQAGICFELLNFFAMTPKTLKIGLFGFGCVGQGLYDILIKNESLKGEITKICVKHPDKKRSLPAEFFTYNAKDILDNPEINLIVELIDNASDAYKIVSEALQKGKTVVTANKKMLAEHLPELVALQQKHQASLLYEASACGSIPIIRNLEEYYDNELLYSVSGIFNGSTNYILTKIIKDNLSYEEALKQAQDLGFAESDPTLDVGGFDPKYKLCIIALHAFGLFVNPDEVFNYGIEQFSLKDLQYAKEKGYQIKLIAQAQKTREGKVALFLMPQFINHTHPLYYVENETNGVIVEAVFSQKQVFIGKGAGGHPTGSAVLSDISASLYNYRYEYKKRFHRTPAEYSSEIFLEIYLRYEKTEDVDLLDFETITERYESKDYKYVIGVVGLKSLKKAKNALQKRNLFVAHTGKQFSQESLLAQKGQEHTFELAGL